MGYIRHHAIIVTSFDEHLIIKARDAAKRAVDSSMVTPVIMAPLNSYGSFAVLPDGSKEGWPESELADNGRSSLIRWLDAQRHDDGSSSISWVEVQYGDDNRESRVCRHSDEESRRFEARKEAQGDG